MNIIDTIIRKILHKLIYRKNKKPDQILNDIFINHKKKFIIQIGGNDGISNDPLRKFFKYTGNYEAIIFEPVKYYHLKLSQLYKNRKDIKVKKNFVSNTNKKKKIFFIKPSIANLMDADGPKNKWAHGQGSFSKKFIYSSIDKNKFRGDYYKKNISKFKNSIISETVNPFKISKIRFPEKSINLLLMDVQGHELQVIRSINFKKQKIDYIYFEDENPTSKNSIQIKNLLKKNKYKLIGRLSWIDQVYCRIN